MASVMGVSIPLLSMRQAPFNWDGHPSDGMEVRGSKRGVKSEVFINMLERYDY